MLSVYNVFLLSIYIYVCWTILIGHQWLLKGNELTLTCVTLRWTRQNFPSACARRDSSQEVTRAGVGGRHERSHRARYNRHVAPLSPPVILRPYVAGISSVKSYDIWKGKYKYKGSRDKSVLFCFMRKKLDNVLPLFLPYI